MEQSPMIFADGMNFKPRHEKAPDTVRGGIYFHATKFSTFLDRNKDSKGYVNIKMMKSKKDGSIYFILDTWKPKVSEEDRKMAQDYNDGKYKTIEEVPTTSVDPDTGEAINLDDIPF